jgi:hypothetical protein
VSESEDIGVRAGFCRKMADRTLKNHGVTGPPVPVERIASSLGFCVREVPLPPRVDARLRIEGSERVIEVAEGQHEHRHRFSIAHELGHFLLDHRNQASHVAETEANKFAGALLAPGRWLAPDFRKGLKIETLVARYAVSRDVIFIALKTARVI